MYNGRTRQDDYLKFCNDMGLDDPMMTDLKPEARDYFLACYIVSLVQGETILGTPIKHDTIKQ